MNVLGIYREKIFSPGKVQEDKEIMDRTLTEISKLGIVTEAISPESIPEKCKADIVLNMAQSAETLSMLSKWEKDGIRIINSSNSITNCYRRNMIRLLKKNGLPIPKSWVYSIEIIEDELFQIHLSGWIGSYWIKRGNFHAIEPSDVVRVNSFKEMEKALINFKVKGVKQIIIQEHVEGKIIKFYGAGREYIKAFLLPDNREIALDSGIKHMIFKAIECLGLEIYGGDMIIEPSGNTFLIDINDWPSFSLCQDEAARRIASYTKKVMEDFDGLSTRAKSGR